MNIFKRIASVSWMPLTLSILGGLVYIFHAGVIAQTTTSFLDEGLYTYKGYLFASGVYKPFQDFGPWTNHAVLSFLIPGYIQKWFGMGLVTARYSMIFISLFTLLGLWLFARRWSGHWLAAGAVWVMALNPAEIKIHTLALSQGLVALILVWILILTVGVRRPLWQIVLGSALAGGLILIRENLIFVLPLLALYIWWQYGWKVGLMSALCGGLIFLIGNAVYYPDVLKFWALRLPRAYTPFLDAWRTLRSAMGTSIPEPENITPYRMFLYFWLTFRLHFVALVSAVTVWLLWPIRIRKPITARVRAAVFLSVLLVVLFFAHIRASFFGEYCISCILLYVAYFDFIGLMLLAVAARFLLRELSAPRRWLVFAVGTILIVAVSFSTHEDISSTFANSMVDRLQDAYVWNVMKYVTGLPELILFRTSFAILCGIIAVVAFAIGLRWARRFYNDRQAWMSLIGTVGLYSLLIVGLILSPTQILGKGNDFFDCGGSNVFASYEKAGRDLRNVIPAGSKIYWEGRILAIFLYMPDVKIYPPQMNQFHSFRVGGDSDVLLRNGFWNENLARQWLKEADYIMIEKGEVLDFEKTILESGGYVRVMSTSKVEKCRWQSIIDVYQRVDAKP